MKDLLKVYNAIIKHYKKHRGGQSRGAIYRKASELIADNWRSSTFYLAKAKRMQGLRQHGVRSTGWR